MKKRILVIARTPEYGGAEKHLLELVTRFDASTVDCTILCYASDFFTSRLQDRPSIRVVSRQPINSFWSYWRTFTSFRPDIIFFVKGIYNHYPWYTYLAAKLSGAKRLVVIEQLIADPAAKKIIGGGGGNFLRNLFGWRARYMVLTWLQARLIDTTICVSKAVRERLVHEYGYPEHKTVTICNGVDRHYYDSIQFKQGNNGDAHIGTGSQETIIVCVARLSPVKRIDLLLDALSYVAKSHSSWKCAIVGSGPLEEELRARSAALGLSDSVQFTGHVNDVRPYLNMAGVFVLSSEKEGLPLALLEAMAMGLPCIATDVGGNSEVIEHGQTGLIVKFGSPEELAQAIEYLLDHASERHRMGEQAKQRVREHFDIEQTMTKIQTILLG